MNSKKIEYNIEFICNLCKRFLNMDVSESDFKQGLGDLQFYFTYNSKEYLLKYDDYLDEFVLYGKNLAGNKSGKHAYHIEMKELSLISLFKKVKTRHSPRHKDLNTPMNHVYNEKRKLDRDRKLIQKV